MYRSIRISSARSPIIVIGAWSGETSPGRGLGTASGLDRAAARAAMRAAEFSGEAGQVAPAGPGQLVLGLGARDRCTGQTLRTAAAGLVRELDRRAARAAVLHVTEVLDAKRITAEHAGRCMGEGMGLANWRVDFFDGSASTTPPPRAALAVHAGDRSFRAGLKRGLILAECANEARRLAATPPNICHPTWLAGRARALAREVGLRCRVISYAEARRQGMGGLVNVGRASAHKPCLIILEHRPARTAAAARGQRLALVGKSITYDTGGYSIKPGNSMKGMKYDKCGGMAVLGAMRAVATLKVPVPVVGLLPAAENMIGGDAYRPDDIITLYNGVSVEVTNTDAEGRLVLADALAYACRRLKPTAMLDVATLTGGVVTALGGWCAGMWCNDQELRRRVEAAAETSGERVWRLPLWDEHREFMRSRHADIWNSGPKRDGHPIQGAAFLSFFVDESVPWCHLDIAGVANVDSAQDMYVQGPTGYGVRLLTELVEGYARK